MQIIEKLKNENDPEAQKALSEISKELLEKISREGLGYMSKTDLETFIFHLYLKNLSSSISDYDLMTLFKITPTKLRSIEMNRSVKYQQLELENNENRLLLITFFDNAIQKNAFELPDNENGNVRFYVPNSHIYRIIEKYIVDQGSSPNYRPNPKQMEIRYDCLISLLEEVYSKQCDVTGNNNWKRILNKSLCVDLKNRDKIKNASDSVESMLTAFKENLKEEGFK